MKTARTDVLMKKHFSDSPTTRDASRFTIDMLALALAVAKKEIAL